MLTKQYAYSVLRHLFVSSVFFLALIGKVSSIFASELPDFTALVEKNSPAVVKIQVEINAARPRASMGLPHGGRGPEATGLGSGFVIEQDGYILTNSHVVKDASRVVVRMNDRREFDAEVVGDDQRSDIALLKINTTGLPVLKLDTKDQLKVGEWVLAIGSPFGLDYSVSQGIVSAIGRSLPNGENENYIPFIQTDVAINPGNSGGPLFNLAGDVVGINSQIFTRSGGSMGLSFAIPASVVRNVVAQLKSRGYVSRGWLGVSIQEVDRSLAESFGLSKPEGALVAQVLPGSPAEKAGIVEGDVITGFNGKSILYSGDLPHLVGQQAPGTRSNVVLVRHGQQKTVAVEVGELPDRQAHLGRNKNTKATSDNINALLGMRLENLSVDHASQLHVIGGVVVRSIMRGSAAERAGLRPDDVIVQMGFINVDSVATFQSVVKGLQQGSIQPVRFFREGQPLFRSIVID